MVEHPARTVGLQAMYVYTECGCVDRRLIFSSPNSGREYDLWFDDEGLLHERARPNRRIGGAIFCGTLMICKSDSEGNSLPLDDREAEVMMRLAQQWERLDPETTEKPEPSFQVTTFDSLDELPRRKG